MTTGSPASRAIASASSKSARAGLCAVRVSPHGGHFECALDVAEHDHRVPGGPATFEGVRRPFLALRTRPECGGEGIGPRLGFGGGREVDEGGAIPPMLAAALHHG